jgi:hypothetical protein
VVQQVGARAVSGNLLTRKMTIIKGYLDLEFQSPDFLPPPSAKR